LAEVTEEPSLKYNPTLSNARKGLLQTATPFYEWLAEQSPNDMEMEQVCARANGRLGLMHLSIGEPDQAIKAFEKQRAILSKTASSSPGSPEPLSQLGQVCHQLALAKAALDRPAEAQSLLKQALEHQKAAQNLADLPRYGSLLADHYNGLGNFFIDQEKFTEAEPALREALALRTTLAAEHRNQSHFAYLLAETQRDLGGVVLRLGRAGEAEPLLRAALRQQEKFLGDYPDVTDLRVAVAATQVNMAALLRDGGAADQALPMLTQAVATLEPVARQEPLRPTIRPYLRDAHANRAETLQRLGRYGEAAADWDRAAALDDGRQRPRLSLNTATALARAGDAEGALKQVKSLELYEVVPADQLSQLARACSVAAATTKDAAQREQCAVKAIELLRQAVSKGYKDINHLKKDADWEALRRREDFRRVVEGIKP
jgi:tetratricopeptide (TPR) repeat protein